jgi:cobalt-zinc-cadmium efflux system outer membrane protein
MPRCPVAPPGAAQSRRGPRRGACLLALLTCWQVGMLHAQTGPTLSLPRAQALAEQSAPMLAARRAALEAAEQMRAPAGELPDPRVTIALENLPISGPMRYSLVREGMTQRTFGWMQDMPNAAKRSARVQAAQARADRERAQLEADRLTVRREVAQAWVMRWSAEARLALFQALEDENRLLLDTLAARLAAGTGMPADATMARQDAVMLADRRDELQRERAQALASLRRWLGDDAALPLAGEPAAPEADAQALRQGIERHADLQTFDPMLRMAQSDVAEMEAARRGDWAWQVMYSRRGPDFGDMVGFQFTFELPLWSARRQDPQAAARRRDADRIVAERDEMLRRRREEVDLQLAELDELALKAARLRSASIPLAQERVALAMTAYQSARGDLAAVLAARRERAELDLRAIELAARQHALRARLNDLIAEPR